VFGVWILNQARFARTPAVGHGHAHQRLAPGHFDGERSALLSAPGVRKRITAQLDCDAEHVGPSRTFC
jgi:hypothetical protein